MNEKREAVENIKQSLGLPENQIENGNNKNRKNQFFLSSDMDNHEIINASDVDEREKEGKVNYDKLLNILTSDDEEKKGLIIKNDRKTQRKKDRKKKRKIERKKERKKERKDQRKD